MRRAFNAWEASSRNAAKREALLVSAVATLHNIGMRRALNSWLEAHQVMAPIMPLLERAGGRLRCQSLSRGWHSWVHMATEQAEALRRLRSSMCFLIIRQLAVGFATWKASHATRCEEELKLDRARGSLHANLEVVHAVLETPALLQPEHLECLELLVAVDSCEDELLMEQFGPTPGSAKYLVSAWDKDIFPTLKAAHNASEPSPAYVIEIFEALKACDVEKARGIARPHVKKAQAYIAYAKKRRQALALPQEGGAPEKSAKAGSISSSFFATSARTTSLIWSSV